MSRGFPATVSGAVDWLSHLGVSIIAPRLTEAQTYIPFAVDFDFPNNNSAEMATNKLLPSLAKSVSKLTTNASRPALWTPTQRGMASVVHPVTQDSTSKHGPTAMVFMNMGGPSTTDEVGNFLSRLFVRHPVPLYVLAQH